MAFNLIKRVRFSNSYNIRVTNVTKRLFCLHSFLNAKFSVDISPDIISRKEQVEAVKKNEYVMPVIDYIGKLGINKDKFMELVAKEPSLSQQNHTDMLGSIMLLLDYGFEGDHIIKMISECPDIVSYNRETLKETMDIWREFHYGEQFLCHVFGRYPELLTLDNIEVKRRLPKLRYYMGDKISRVTRLIFNSPDVLYQDWQNLENKFNYLLGTMAVTTREISDSQALSYSLNHIKTRHIFLEKAGIYIRPDPKEKMGLSKHRNPKLHEIIDTADEEFALHVAKINPKEYFVFMDLLKYVEKEEDTYVPKCYSTKNFDLNEEYMDEEYLSDDDDDD